MTEFHSFYSSETVQSLHAREKRRCRTAVLTACLTLFCCILLCLGVTTRNADLRRAAVIACSTLGSFTAVALLECGALPLRREAAHVEGVLGEPEEVLSGRITHLGSSFSIPKSISFLPVELAIGESGSGAPAEPAIGGNVSGAPAEPAISPNGSGAPAEMRSLKLNARLSKPFPSPGQHVCLRVRRGYITSWEETSP